MIISTVYIFVCHFKMRSSPLPGYEILWNKKKFIKKSFTNIMFFFYVNFWITLVSISLALTLFTLVNELTDMRCMFKFSR